MFLLVQCKRYNIVRGQKPASRVQALRDAWRGIRILYAACSLVPRLSGGDDYPRSTDKFNIRTSARDILD